MGVVERRKALFENIARMRRAERRLPPDRDLVAVRSALEAELGEVVSRRQAARLLGVSHTAVGRWTASGELPVVTDSRGREGIPVAELLDLHEAVEAERAAGRRSRHLLEPSMVEGRRRASDLDSDALVDGANGDAAGHRKAELRSLAYHRALAQRLRRPMVDDALRLIWKWRDQGSIDPRYADRWEEILRQPIADIRRIISEDSQPAQALRQTSPFAGMLSEPERQKILDEIR
jgi:hypothetical protein